MSYDAAHNAAYYQQHKAQIARRNRRLGKHGKTATDQLPPDFGTRRQWQAGWVHFWAKRGMPAPASF